MNSKLFFLMFIAFGVFCAFAQAGRLTARDHDDNDDDNSNDTDGDDDDNDADLQQEKRAIRSFLQDDEDASQFLDRSSRLFSSQKGQMKEAKKKYEEKCERLLHPRYCPDLATWPAWNQAFNSASGKK